jgi:uncharacterized protein YjbJ (UPF0337 family)
MTRAELLDAVFTKIDFPLAARGTNNAAYCPNCVSTLASETFIFAHDACNAAVRPHMSITGTPATDGLSARQIHPKIYMEMVMDWNRVQGSWKQLEGKVKAKWGKLTDDDLTAINGRREELEGKIQQRYGLAKDQARKEIDDWFASQGF